MKQRTPIIAPSLLAASAGSFSTEISCVEQAGADYLHIDVMDGHFVPNLSFGPNIVSGIRLLSLLLFDVHLMIENPLRFVNAFIDAGADAITVHPETGDNIAEIMKLCKKRGVKSGLALKPETSLLSIAEFLPDCDILLIMSINPGFGGQRFMPAALGRIREADSIRKILNAHYKISVDGGINQETGVQCLSAGADILVAGSAIFGSDNPAAAIADLKGIQT